LPPFETCRGAIEGLVAAVIALEGSPTTGTVVGLSTTTNVLPLITVVDPVNPGSCEFTAIVVEPGSTTSRVPETSVWLPGSAWVTALKGTVAAVEMMTKEDPEITVVEPEIEADGGRSPTGMVVRAEMMISLVPLMTVGVPVIGSAPIIEATMEPTECALVVPGEVFSGEGLVGLFTTGEDSVPGVVVGFEVSEDPVWEAPNSVVSVAGEGLLVVGKGLLVVGKGLLVVGAGLVVGGTGLVVVGAVDVAG
jgi:hypothetical protein